MDYPGLDPKKLTDDVLLAKISDLHGKMVFYHNNGSTQQVMDQLAALLETLEFEQMTRLSKKMVDSELKSSGVQVETEQDLKPKKDDSQEQKKDKKGGPAKGSIFKRTSKPSNDGPAEN